MKFAKTTASGASLLGRLGRALEDLRRHDSALWRRAIDAGVNHGPDAFVRYSPPLFGVAVWALLPDMRRRVLRNLRLALGERGHARETLDVVRTFAAFASCMTDAFISGSERGDALESVCVHDERFVDAMGDGRGVIVVTAHTGGWQSSHAMLRDVHGAEVVVVMRRERDPRAQALSDRVRDRTGLRVVYLGDDPLDVLVLAKHLRSGGVVALQIDRLPLGVRGRKGQLFGKSHEVPDGPLRLAAITGAPIVSVFSRRLGYMKYEVVVGEPIRIPRRASEAELDRAASAWLRDLEGFVTKSPTQWFHFE